MGTRQRKNRKQINAIAFQESLHVPPRVYASTKGLKNTLKYYGAFSWMYPALRALLPSFVSTLQELGLAMINTVNKGYDKSILEVKDIVILAKA